MPLTTRLTQQLGLSVPIISAPMPHAAGGKLAAAVSAAGGLGFIGGGYGEDLWLEHQFELAGRQKVGCGFVTWSLAKRPFLLDLALDRFPVAIMLSFGDPEPFAERIRGDGVKLICQVHSKAHGLRALEVGADIIVAQGGEGGGHGGLRATMALVPEIADMIAARAPETLLVAAGGIADGRGLAASLMLGADGAMMRTRFWASREALVHPNLQATAIAADGDATIRTSQIDKLRGLTWPPEFTARVLSNDFAESCLAAQASAPLPEDAAGRYFAAMETGDPSQAAIYVGEAIGLIDDVPPAAALIERVAREAAELLGIRAPAFVA
ncbi:MAG: nitronate monooxygenase [Hyphomicrobiales bacterium]|nr:nitronate monooxygenase [Hyphomicrobiales bacterium]